MRLNPDEVNLIIAACDSFITGEAVELRLYGSRVNDALKGGDIDLLVLTENDEFSARLREKKHNILAAIKKNLGDQKIDLVISTKQNIQEDPFIKMILPESILLKNGRSKPPFDLSATLNRANLLSLTH